MDIHPITMNIATIVVVGIFMVYWYFRNRYKYWEKRNLPYLEPRIPFGNFKEVWYNRTVHFGECFANAYMEFKKLGAKHGGIFALNKPVYIPVDPSIIKHILITDAENFLDHGFYNNVEEDPLSGHIFNMDGNRWKFLRTNVTQAFTSAKLKKMFHTILHFSEELVDSLEKIPEDDGGIDVKSHLKLLLTDIISSCGYGLDTKLMKGENRDLLKHIHHFNIDQWSLYKMMVTLFVPKSILKMFKYKVFPIDNTKYVRTMFADLKGYRTKNNVHRDDLADIILKLNDGKIDHRSPNGGVMEPLTENEFIAQMWVFLCASTDSTAVTITFALYELAKNQEYQTKLRNEINSVLEKHGGEMTYEALREMHYLECVVDEALRMYPVFPIVPRMCKNDYKVPGTDFILEKNTFILVTNYGIQRDSEYYPDPTKFDPERFTPENKANRPSIAFIPFGDGPRICPAKLFGYLKSRVTLATIVKNFEISLGSRTTPGFEYEKLELFLKKTGDIWLKMKKISN